MEHVIGCDDEGLMMMMTRRRTASRGRRESHPPPLPPVRRPPTHRRERASGNGACFAQNYYARLLFREVGRANLSLSLWPLTRCLPRTRHERELTPHSALVCHAVLMRTDLFLSSIACGREATRKGPAGKM